MSDRDAASGVATAEDSDGDVPVRSAAGAGQESVPGLPRAGQGEEAPKRGLTIPEYAAAMIQRDRERALRRYQRIYLDASYATEVEEHVEYNEEGKTVAVSYDTPKHWKPERRRVAIAATKSRKDAPVYLQMAQAQVESQARRDAENDGPRRIYVTIEAPRPLTVDEWRREAITVDVQTEDVRKQIEGKKDE